MMMRLSNTASHDTERAAHGRRRRSARAVAASLLRRLTGRVTRHKVGRRIPFALLLLVSTTAAAGWQGEEPVSLNFESIPGMTAINYFDIGTVIPAGARLSNQLQASHGVSFRSGVDYVALVRLGSGHATSGVNGIGGVSTSNLIRYAQPLVIAFSMPGSPSVPAVTNFVSLRGDQNPAPGSARMEAFDLGGALVGSVSAADVRGGLTLSLSAPNIHSIRITQTRSDIAFDDLRFNPLKPGLSARPIADAGPDQPTHAGRTVMLDGFASSDDNTATENLLFAWTLVARPGGSSAALAGADSMRPTFVADLPGEYVISLVVTDADGQSSDPDIVVVSSLNAAPVADAGADQGAFVGRQVTLNGAASHDPDSDPLSFSWTLAAPEGSGAVLSAENTAHPIFTPDIPGAYTATLTVTDPFGAASTDGVVVVAITVEQFAAELLANALNTVGALTPEQLAARGHRQALQNLLAQALAALQAGEMEEARSKLRQAIERTDGCALRGGPDGGGPGRDWVTDCAAQTTLHEQLTAALDMLTP
jgi:PKD repeat protein